MDPIAFSLSPMMDKSTMNVSHMVVMGDHGVILMPVTILMTIVSLTVQVTMCWMLNVIIMMTNLFSVEVCQTSCEFPFTYNEDPHYMCITHDNDGTPWCDIGNSEKGNCTTCPGNRMLTVKVKCTNHKLFYS